MDSSVWGTFHAPGPHTNEELVDRVWFHNPEADDDGTHTIVLHSRGSGSGRPMGLYFRYDLEQMPELTTWSHMVAGEYICGIEPCVGPSGTAPPRLCSAASCAWLDSLCCCAAATPICWGGSGIASVGSWTRSALASVGSSPLRSGWLRELTSTHF